MSSKNQQVSSAIDKAKEVCALSGARLTEKRTRILELLLLSKTPLSAYELRDEYERSLSEPIPTMTIYRILEFLETKHLVHKLSSTKRYVACADIVGGCRNQTPQFLICSGCKSTKEIAPSKGLMDELRKLAESAGYTLQDSQLELQCLCKNCALSAI